MYLVGGSEGSLLFNTPSQITGYEPGVNSTKKKNHNLLYRLPIHLSIRYRSSYPLYFLINIGSYTSTITNSLLFTPIPHATRQFFPQYHPINALRLSLRRNPSTASIR